MGCSLAGKCCSATISVVNFLCFAFGTPVISLPSEVPKLPLILPARAFPSVWKLLLLHNSLLGHRSQFPNSLSLFFYLYLLCYITLRRLPWLFGCLGSSASIKKVVCWSCSLCRGSFDVFIGGKKICPSYSYIILKVSPVLGLSCVFSGFFNETETILYVHLVIFFWSWAHGKMYFPVLLQLGSMSYHITSSGQQKTNENDICHIEMRFIKTSHPQSSFLLMENRCWSGIHEMEATLSLSPTGPK